MLSDEEKQAIEYLKRHIIPCYGRKGTIEFMLNDTLLNLIEKQQKEIEELYQDNITLIQEINQRWLDKIKAKIEDIESQINDIKDNLDYEYNETMVNEVWRLENKIDVLQSL